MELKYTPQRSSRTVDYELNGNILTITENGKSLDVDVTQLDENHGYPIVEVTNDAVTVIRFYSEDEKDEFED